MPGLEIYRLAFAHRQVGLASALAIVLMILVIALHPAHPVAHAGAEEMSDAATLKSPAIGVFAARGILVILMFVTLLPFLSMFTAALAPSGTYPDGLQWPADPQWGNFVDAFNSAKLDRLLLSSLTIVACVVPASVLFGTMAGFGLAKLAPRGSQFVYLLFVLGLTLPLEVVIIPIYYEMQWLGLLNTKFAIILPLIGLFMPFSIFWMRAHFVNVPAEMSEAAEIDGASVWQQFWLVQVPLARPAVLSLAILQFLWTWNSFLLAAGAGARCRSSAPWRGRSGRSRGSGEPTSRCSAPAPC